MKKIVVSEQRITREYMANPHKNVNLEKRLTKSGCIKYGTQKKIIDLGNGYIKIEPK